MDNKGPFTAKPKDVHASWCDVTLMTGSVSEALDSKGNAEIGIVVSGSLWPGSSFWQNVSWFDYETEIVSLCIYCQNMARFWSCFSQ